MKRGWTCDCGERHYFGVYVAAHTHDHLVFTCPSGGEQYDLKEYIVTHAKSGACMDVWEEHDIPEVGSRWRIRNYADPKKVETFQITSVDPGEFPVLHMKMQQYPWPDSTLYLSMFWKSNPTRA